MTFARYHVGDSLTVLRTLPDASVDLVLTSPPFLALRSYLPADHPDKALEMGSEPTPGAFIDALLDIVEECRRVLAPHGSLCFELGDTYAGSGGAGGDYAEGGLRDGQPMSRQGYLRNDRANRVPQEAPKSASKPKNNRFSQPDAGPRTGPGRSTSERPGWPLDKSLCLIPELFRFALVYGFNPLTGRETPRWRARNVVRWCRPNPPVGALADKVRPATSDMVIACMSRKRYFDLDAIRGPSSPNTHARTAAGVESRPSMGKTADDERRGGNFSTLATIHTTDGAPPLDHWWHDEDTFDQDAWLISTEPYKGPHYATWPEALVEKPIEAMCPRRICIECGKPSERVIEKEHRITQAVMSKHPGSPSVGGIMGRVAETRIETTGWTDCGHDTWRDGIILDPFAGSGTTLGVAFGHGRSSIGIDLDRRNAELARQRVGMWLEVDEPAYVDPHTVDVPVGDAL